MKEIEIWKLLLRKAKIYHAIKRYGICDWLFTLWKTKQITSGEYDMMKERLIWYLKTIQGRTTQIGYAWYMLDPTPRLVFITKIIKQLQNGNNRV